MLAPLAPLATLWSPGQESTTLCRAVEARAEVWPLVAFDMEWVVANWGQSGCDLWEEFTSDDFYWNRMAYVYSLNSAADFADSVGQDGSGWRSVAAPQLRSSSSSGCWRLRLLKRLSIITKAVTSTRRGAGRRTVP